MTLNTSEVAVCCSSDLLSQSVRPSQFAEQARILDGDDGLPGEVFD